MSSVDRDALSSVGGHGVAEVDVVGDVVSWQDDRAAVLAVEAADHQ